VGQLRVARRGVTAVDDPPPNLDDWRKPAGDFDGSGQAPDAPRKNMLTLLMATKLMLS